MKPTRPRERHAAPAQAVVSAAEQRAFADVVEMIRTSRGRALAAVNSVLIDLYWKVGEFVAQRSRTDGWGKGTVAALSAYIQERHPGLRGFSPQNLWRMRQFFEAYCDRPELSTLLENSRGHPTCTSSPSRSARRSASSICAWRRTSDGQCEKSPDRSTARCSNGRW